MKTIDGNTMVCEVGEESLLEYILRTLRGFEEGLLPRGDDAAALEFHGNLVMAVDMFVEKTDKPEKMSWRDAGYKAVVSSLSDLAAKGAEPKYLLVSLGLRRDMKVREFNELWSGVLECSSEYDVVILGGDLGEADNVVIDVTCIGCGDRLIPRNGARVGDLIAVTGEFGKTGAALHALLNGEEVDNRLLEAFLRPRARIREGKALAGTGAVSSCIDSSDGLAFSLSQITRLSGVAAVIHSLPASREAEEYASRHSLEINNLVLYSGEEYELVFTFNRDKLDDVKTALESVGCRLLVIGEIAEGQGVYLKTREGDVVKLRTGGFEHFKV